MSSANHEFFKNAYRGALRGLRDVFRRGPVRPAALAPAQPRSPSAQSEPANVSTPKAQKIPAEPSTPRVLDVEWTQLGEIHEKHEGKPKRILYSDFYRGEDCNFGPWMKDYADADFIERFIMLGHAPNAPFINRDTRLTAFGSCFAENITKHLTALDFNLSKQRDPDIYISWLGEGLVNVHAILSQFEWALEGSVPPGELWHGRRGESFLPDEEIRLRTKKIFETTDVFVITFGLSEIWYDAETGGTFWRAVPMKAYDPERHKFRVCSHQETLAALFKIYRLIRKHTKAKIVFTLSPIPLFATFRPQSCITANAASKAVLRSALDEFFRSEQVSSDPDCFYFPAYEMVTTLFAGPFKNDGRHPRDIIIDAIMKVFEAFYCTTGLTRADAGAAFRQAQWQCADRAPMAYFRLKPKDEAVPDAQAAPGA